MKVSFSRKGFDSANGGQANAILPDGTLLPFPIPCSDGVPNTFESVHFGERSIYDIITDIKPRTKLKADTLCHLDPDLRMDVKPRLAGWRPAFGQSNQSLSELFNNQFGINDLFLFFGWFKETEIKNGRLIYKKGAPDLHLIYGYMQVDSIIKVGDEIPKWLSEHPHSSRLINGSRTDAIFLPTERLTFAPELPGASMLKFAPELVLTAPGLSRSKWKLPYFFRDIKIGHSPKQPEDGSYFKSASIGQEMIWDANEFAIPWLSKICSNQ